MSQTNVVNTGSEFSHMCTCGKTDWCDNECAHRGETAEEAPKARVYQQPSLSALVAPLLEKYGK